MLFLSVQNDRYLLLTAQLYDARDMAAVAKTKGDKTGQRSAQDRIRIILQGQTAPLTESCTAKTQSLAKYIDLIQSEYVSTLDIRPEMAKVHTSVLK